MVQHDKLTQILMHLFMLILVLSCVLPFLLMLMASFTDESALIRNGYSFWPEKFSLETYRYIAKSGNMITHGYLMTVLVTVVGTAANIILTLLFAYPLSRKSLPFRNFFSFYLFFTTLFSGGVVPSYVMWTQIFHIRNTFWAWILPGGLLGAMQVIMMRNYFSSSIPDSLIEAAKLDGAGEILILRQVVIPLAKPMIATMVLMTGLGFWNGWVNGLYYITEQRLYTIQMILQEILTNIDFMSKNASMFGADVAAVKLPAVGVRMGIAVVAVVPVLIVYPFLQKYFVKGIVIGGIKG